MRREWQEEEKPSFAAFFQCFPEYEEKNNYARKTFHWKSGIREYQRKLF